MFKGQERDLQGTKTANNRQRRQTGQTNPDRTTRAEVTTFHPSGTRLRPEPQHLRSLMPKQPAHSSRAMYLSLSKSQVSKKRVVQCSMGMRGARSGASSVWDRYLAGKRGGGCEHGRTHSPIREAGGRSPGLACWFYPQLCHGPTMEPTLPHYPFLSLGFLFYMTGGTDCSGSESQWLHCKGHLNSSLRIYR